MPPSGLEAPQEAPRDPIEIRDDDAITIHEALTIASNTPFTLGKSTLQRWAKFWHDNPGDAVRCVLVTTRAGNFYKLSRGDFEAWVFDQKQNEAPQEIPRDPIRPLEVQADPPRSRETFREKRDEESQDKIAELESEIFQLRIDLGARKQLLDRAREEMDDLRTMTDNLLRENGALQYQMHQLAPPPAPRREVTGDQTIVAPPGNLPPPSPTT